MRFDDNYGADPNYVGSSLKPTKFYPEVMGTSAAKLNLNTHHERWVGEVTSYTSRVVDDDFIQPAALWEVLGRDPGHQDRLVGNVAAHLKGVESAELRRAVYSRSLYLKRELQLLIRSRSLLSGESRPWVKGHEENRGSSLVLKSSRGFASEWIIRYFCH